MKDFDGILESLGGYGRYQKQMILLVIIPTSFLIGFQVSAVLFQVVVPDHWCDVPGIENTNMTEEQWKNFTIPFNLETGAYQQCEQYSLTWVGETPLATNSTEACVSWHYDKSLMKETLATTNDWVCEDAKNSVHVLSIGIIGNSLSTLILPFLADKYTGRRPMFFFAVSVHAVFSLLLIFTKNFALHMAFRFLAACSFQTNYQTSFMIALEFLDPHRRNLAEFTSFVAWAIGMCVTAGVSYLVADWRYITCFGILTDALMWLLWWYLPESPRWLLTKQREEEALAVLLKIAKVNGKDEEVDKKTLASELEKIENPTENEVSVRTIVKYPKFCFRAFVIIIISGAVFLGYGIIGLNIDVLPNRYFMNFFLLSLVEIPSNVCSWFLVQYLGRRFASIASYVLSAIISLVAIIIVEYKVALLIVVGILKWVLTTGIYVVYLQSAEFYPTGLRATGMGAIAVFGTATLSIVPYIIDSDVHGALNYWVILAVCLLCALCSLPLPETLGLPLPQTLPEANRLGQNRPLTKWINHWNAHEYADMNKIYEQEKKDGKKDETEAFSIT